MPFSNVLLVEQQIWNLVASKSKWLENLTNIDHSTRFEVVIKFLKNGEKKFKVIRIGS